MTDTAASLYDVTSFDGRIPLGDCRRMVRGAIIGLAALAAAGALVISVTLAASWIVNTAFSTNPHIHARASLGPGSFALANPGRTVPGAANFTALAVADTPDANFETRWARARIPGSALANAVPLLPEPATRFATDIPSPPQRPRAATLPQVAKLTPIEAPASTSIRPLPPPERASNVPLPPRRPLPAEQNVASSPVRQPAPQIVMAAPQPPAGPRVPPRQAPDRLASLPAADSRTALYDIAAHTVYLPNGEKLEAHSGLGDKLDDPRFVSVRMRGPTPPNVYDLTLREESFHGVQAIRLNPVDDDTMFGRAGMLAHSYMLGPNGQSNGCVSFKDYPAFLHAFLNGEVDRLVVVAHLDRLPASVARARRGRVDRYAFNGR